MNTASFRIIGTLHKIAQNSVDKVNITHNFNFPLTQPEKLFPTENNFKISSLKNTLYSSVVVKTT